MDEGQRSIASARRLRKLIVYRGKRLNSTRSRQSVTRGTTTLLSAAAVTWTGGPGRQSRVPGVDDQVTTVGDCVYAVRRRCIHDCRSYRRVDVATQTHQVRRGRRVDGCHSLRHQPASSRRSVQRQARLHVTTLAMIAR